MMAVEVRITGVPVRPEKDSGIRYLNSHVAIRHTKQVMPVFGTPTRVKVTIIVIAVLVLGVLAASDMVARSSALDLPAKWIDGAAQGRFALKEGVNRFEFQVKNATGQNVGVPLSIEVTKHGARTEVKDNLFEHVLSGAPEEIKDPRVLTVGELDELLHGFTSSESRPVLARAEALRHAVFQQFPDKNCSFLAWAFAQAGRDLNLETRVVYLSANRTNQYDSHTVAEVFVPELNKWVIMDPTFDAYYTVDGVKASAYEVFRAVSQDRSDHVTIVQQAGFPASRNASSYYVNPIQLFQHMRIHIGRVILAPASDMTDAELANPYVITSSQPDDFFRFHAAPKSEPLPFLLKYHVGANYLTYQLIGNEHAGSISIRSTSPPHWLPGLDEDDDDVVEEANLVPNALMTADKDGDGVADGWSPYKSGKFELIPGSLSDGKAQHVTVSDSRGGGIRIDVPVERGEHYLATVYVRPLVGVPTVSFQGALNPPSYIPVNQLVWTKVAPPVFTATSDRLTVYVYQDSPVEFVVEKVSVKKVKPLNPSQVTVTSR